MSDSDQPFDGALDKLTKRALGVVAPYFLKGLAVATDPFFRFHMGHRYFSYGAMTTGLILWLGALIACCFCGGTITNELSNHFPAAWLARILPHGNSPSAFIALAVVAAYVVLTTIELKFIKKIKYSKPHRHTMSRGAHRIKTPYLELGVKIAAGILLLVFAPPVALLFGVSLAIAEILKMRQEATLLAQYYDTLDGILVNKYLSTALLNQTPPEETFLYEALSEKIPADVRKDVASTIGSTLKGKARPPKESQDPVKTLFDVQNQLPGGTANKTSQDPHFSKSSPLPQEFAGTDPVAQNPFRTVPPTQNSPTPQSLQASPVSQSAIVPNSDIQTHSSAPTLNDTSAGEQKSTTSPSSKTSEHEVLLNQLKELQRIHAQNNELANLIEAAQSVASKVAIAQAALSPVRHTKPQHQFDPQIGPYKSAREAFIALANKPQASRELPVSSEASAPRDEPQNQMFPSSSDAINPSAQPTSPTSTSGQSPLEHVEARLAQIQQSPPHGGSLSNEADTGNQTNPASPAPAQPANPETTPAPPQVNPLTTVVPLPMLPPLTRRIVPLPLFRPAVPSVPAQPDALKQLLDAILEIKDPAKLAEAQQLIMQRYGPKAKPTADTPLAPPAPLAISSQPNPTQVANPETTPSPPQVNPATPPVVPMPLLPSLTPRIVRLSLFDPVPPSVPAQPDASKQLLEAILEIKDPATLAAAQQLIMQRYGPQAKPNADTPLAPPAPLAISSQPNPTQVANPETTPAPPQVNPATPPVVPTPLPAPAVSCAPVQSQAQTKSHMMLTDYRKFVIAAKTGGHYVAPGEANHNLSQNSTPQAAPAVSAGATPAPSIVPKDPKAAEEVRQKEPKK